MKTRNHFFRTLIFSFTCISVFTIAPAQTAPLGWKFAITATDAQLASMHSDSLGNIYIIGEFTRDAFEYNQSSVPGITGKDEINTFLAKINPAGEKIWMKSIRGTSSGARIRPGKSAINERGEFLFSFTTENTGTFQLGRYSTTANIDQQGTYLAKVTKSGHIAWVNHIKVEPDTVESAKIADLFLEENGTAIITGHFVGDRVHLDQASINGTGNDAMLFVASIGTRGEINWFNNCAYNTSMDNGQIWPTILANTADGFFYLGGYHEGYRSFYFGSDSIYNAIDRDAFVARFNKNGISTWGKSFSGDSLEYIEKIAVNKANEATVLGFFNSTDILVGTDVFNGMNGYFDIFLANIRPDGIIRNSNSIAVQHPTFDHGKSKTVLKYDFQDRLMLCSEFFGASLFSAANTVTNPDPGTCDILMAQIDPQNLEPVWSRQGTAPGNNPIDGILVGSRGNVYVAGTSYNTLSFDNEDIVGDNLVGSPYLMRMEAEGTLDYVYWKTNTDKDQINIEKVSADKYGNSFVAGSFAGLNNTLDDKTLDPIETSGFFLAKYCRRMNVSGTVKASDGTIFNSGYVKLYGRTMYQRAPLNDTTELGADGSYEFKDVPYGEYILSVVPDEESSASYIPTYYPAFEYWEFAKSIELGPNTPAQTFDIEVQPHTQFEQGGQVGGAVNDLDSTDLFKSTRSFKAKPSKKATVVLAGNGQQKSTYEIIATTETDEFGLFEFPNVAAGSYYLWTDIPGMPVINPYYFVLLNNQSVTNLNYSVNEETVTPDGTPVYTSINANPAESPIRFFPNPASDFLTIKTDNPLHASIDIYNSLGAVVKQFDFSGSNERIDISGLANGNYLIRITTRNTSLTEKFSIVR